MKKIALPLLVASVCMSLQATCGLNIFALKPLKYGSNQLGSLSGANTIGICSYGASSLVQYLVGIDKIEATNLAVGINATDMSLRGGMISISQISGKSAYGIKSTSHLNLAMKTDYSFFIPIFSGIQIETINASSQAYGVYASQNLSIKGGTLLISSVLSSGAEAYGITSLDFNFQKSSVGIDEIQAQNNVYGLKTVDFKGEDIGLTFLNITSVEKDAVGFWLDSLTIHESVIWADMIQAQKGNAVGFYLTSGINYNSDAYFGESQNNLGVSQILAERDAVGIYTPKGTHFDLTTAKYTLRFEKITSNTSNAMGWRNDTYSLNIKADDDLIDLGVIEGKNGSYGIYSDSGDINLDLTNSTLAMSLKGANQKAFYTTNQAQTNITLTNSSLILDGDGGEIYNLRVSNGGNIDLSGASREGLANRESSRSLHIKTLDYEFSLGDKRLSVGLYHNAQKGIADSIIIDDLRVGQNNGIDLNLYYVPSQTPKEQYSLLVKTSNEVWINGISKPNSQGASTVTEGIEDITTIIHRYDQGDVSYYYLDNAEGQIHTLNSQALLPSLYAMEGMLASYFYTLDSVNKRVGDLRAGYDDSGLWGRVSFGGIDTGSGDVDMSLFQIGGDIQITKGDKNYLLGLAVGYSPMLSSNEYLSNLSNLDLSIYAGVFFKNGFYYDTQLKLNYLQVETQANQWLGSASFSQWMMNYSNELGYRLSFGGEGGFYLQPSATLNISLLPPISYSQEVINGNPLEVSSEVLMTFQSLVGGKMGYRFGGVERGFDLFLGAYYDFKGFVKGDMKFKTLGSNNQELSSELKGKFRTLGALQFELGSNIEINKHSKLYLDIDFGFGDVLHTTYKLNASYRFTF